MKIDRLIPNNVICGACDKPIRWADEWVDTVTETYHRECYPHHDAASLPTPTPTGEEADDG